MVGEMYESTNIITTRRFEKAMELYISATEEVTEPDDSRHSFVEMAGLDVTLKEGSTVTTCTAALGALSPGGTQQARNVRLHAGTAKPHKESRRSFHKQTDMRRKVMQTSSEASRQIECCTFPLCSPRRA